MNTKMTVKVPEIVISALTDARLRMEIENRVGKGKNSEEEMWIAIPAVLNYKVLNYKVPSLLAGAYYRLGNSVAVLQ